MQSAADYWLLGDFTLHRQDELVGGSFGEALPGEHVLWSLPPLKIRIQTSFQNSSTSFVENSRTPSSEQRFPPLFLRNPAVW
jgi:hypothetical protein